MELEFNLGVAQDLRPVYEKEQDHQNADLAMGVFIEWKEKKQEEWKKYTPREQNGSLSCCGQSAAKALETLGMEIESAHPIYRSRSNFPSGGMYLQNVGEIVKKIGTTTEKLDPSQFQHESEMNRDITVTTPNKALGYAFVAYKDIDAVAEAIEANRNCLLIFYCNKTEWVDVPKYLGLEQNFGHCITAVDYTIFNGKKCLVIEDSTGHFNSFDKQGVRLITEDFLKARCGGAMTILTSSVKPKLITNRLLKVGSIGNDVKILQIILDIGADGIFGNKTKAAVVNFQIGHHLVGDGVVGPLTVKELNK